ncbi:MAG: Ig-like domain repeat protein [Nocardioides sp.]|uniref:Ig-like domain repeat protein n=1 Tax=Nocardioides sp. TaxID=35761 RepID=UPI0039E3BAF2
MSVSRRLIGSVLGATLALAGVQLFNVPAAHAANGDHVVINEVYGGGGNSGATYKNDFIELYNPTSSAVSLDGWSVQYTSAAGTSITATNNTALTGTIPANGYYLIQEAAGSAGTADLPTPDATGSAALSGTAGKLFLVKSTTALTSTQLAAGAVTSGTGTWASVADMVGFGSTANQFEGAGPTPAPSNTTSVSRNAAHDDNEVNATDFTAGTLSPTNKLNNVAALAVTTPADQTAYQGSAYSLQISATGGSGTKSYALASGTLPAGLSLGAGTGIISGTPTTLGTSSGLAVTVTDDSGSVTTGTFSITVSAPLSAGDVSGVVISEVWGDGGYTGAPFKNSFVELYNTNDTAVSLTGTSLAYMAASSATTPTAGATSQSNISGTIPAHGYFLISGSASSTGAGTALPTADATSSLAWHYADGTIALLDTQAAVSLPVGDLSSVDHVVDALGYGPSGSYNAIAYEGAQTGFATSLNSSAARTPVDSDTNNNATDFAESSPPTPTNSAGTTGTATTTTATCDTTLAAPGSIADVQGSTGTSPYNGCTVTVQGVVTGVYTKSYSSAGALTCGLCGFYIQTAGSGGATDATPGKSDAIFVYGGSSFSGLDSNGDTIAVGDSVSANGKISEYNSVSTAAETLTELNATTSSSTKYTTTVTKVSSLGGITFQTTLPATYADREAHEGEAFAPTDVVITDTYQYETDGELGVATGDKPLIQSTEKCGDNVAENSSIAVGSDDAACLTTYDTDTVNRGYFLGAGTSTMYTTSSTHYKPYASKNSDIPLPFMDATTSARVGAHVQLPAGHAVILDYRHDMSASSSTSGAGKWYLQPERSVSATGCSTAAPHTGCTVDLGTDVIGFENTRTKNAAPADVTGGNSDALKIATYNVENFFTETGEAFAANNPGLKTSPITGETPDQTGNAADGTQSDTTPGCQYDYDRAGNRVLTYQCVSASGQANAWDTVSGAVTGYTAGLANAPRGAARAEDQARQTEKIVTAINGLDADIVSLEELENPNKLKRGIKTDPLHPLVGSADTSELKDQGQGTNIAWRDETISYLVDKLNADLVADGGTAKWAFVASPEEATDATSVVHLCSITRADGSAIVGNDASRATSSCSYASMQDVIRPGFIYDKTKIVPVGQSDIDFPGYTVNGTSDPYGNYVFKDSDGNATSSPFDNAREPLAQYFKRIGDPNSNGFAVVVNHFKSKGNDSTSGVSQAKTSPTTGKYNENYSDARVGANNGNRVAQAQEALRFATAFAKKWGTDKVFLMGDFNAYTGEDPVKAVLTSDANKVENGGLGFTLKESDDPNDLTYSFSTKIAVPTGDTVSYGAAGSIDHVFVSAGLSTHITGTDVWEINANETDAYDYGRYNSNATQFFDGTVPFRGSDHNPEIIGFTLDAVANEDKVGDVQLLGVNDFHGRLLADSSDGGAAPLAGAVKSLRSIYGEDSTIFASAGDNVGASVFESFTQQDKPALDALNDMGLDVSSVGNHEYDKGWKDLVDRIQKAYDADTNPYGADGGLSWGDYLAANVIYSTDPDGDGPLKAGDNVTPGTKTIEVTNPLTGNKVKVGFVGTVTSDLVSLQSPANLDGVAVLDNEATVAKVNELATQLKSDGAALVVLLTHEGAATTDCSTIPSAGTAFSTIVNGVNDDVDAILSGHTHLEYSCSYAVDGWSGKAITKRPVMQAGSYGMALDQLVYSFDSSDEPVTVVANNVGVKGAVGTNFNYPQDADVKAIVDQAKAASEEIGATVLGKMSGPLYRSKLADNTDNRGGESTLGNQVAEIQRWATADSQHGSAEIAFMNPGGLRADAAGTKNGDAYDLTYREAADVQPFANELVNMKLTGAQIKKVLEEQWQRDVNGNIPARPFLKLGISKGFTYTYTEAQDPAKPTGATLGTVTAMWLNGEPIDLNTTYSVTVNSFLATGGDNFWELANGADPEDTELSDLEAQVAYMAQYETDPMQVDYSQRAVRATLTADTDDTPNVYEAGDSVTVNLASLDLNTANVDTVSKKDDTLTVSLGSTVLASGVAVTHDGNGTQPYDYYGSASFTVTLPAGAEGVLRVTGDTTGTEVLIPLGLPTPESTTTAEDQTATYGAAGTLVATVSGDSPSGSVTFSEGSTTIGTATIGSGGVATLSLPEVTLGAGTHTIKATYAGNALLGGSETTFGLTVAKAATNVGASDASVAQGSTASITANVASGATAKPDGTVTLSEGSTVLATGTLADGAVTLSVATGELALGSHTLTVTYGGGDNFAGSTGSATLTVTDPSVKADSTVTAGAQTATYGAAGTLTASVSGGSSTATGTVTFSEGAATLGTATLSGGTATLSLSVVSLSAGTHTIVAAYSGDDALNSSSASFTLTVSAAVTQVAASDATATSGQAATFPVTVSAGGPFKPTGAVTLTLNGAVLASGVLSDGAASLSAATSGLAAGDYLVTVTYAGDGNFATSSTVATLHVTAPAVGTPGNPAPVVGASVPAKIKAKTKKLTVTFTAKGASSTVINGKVTVYDGKKKIGTFTVTKGKAVIKLKKKLKKGKHKLKLVLTASATSKAATFTKVVKVK